MTLKYMQGFETMRADSDFRAQGWVGVAPLTTGIIPSKTGMTGYGLKIIGAGNAPAAAPGSAGATDPGYYNTGVTVNQAWTAGGFTFGMYGTINSGVAASYGSGFTTTATNGLTSEVCFDGSLYWTIQSIGSTYNVATSPDLKNWTVTPAQPATLDNLTCVSYMGNGVVMIGRTSISSTNCNAYYTSNNGSSWSSQVITTFASADVSYVSGLPTGNSSFPHVLYAFGATQAGSIFVGTLGGTLTKVVTNTATSQVSLATPRVIGGLLCYVQANASGGTFSSATASNPALNTAAAWSVATFSVALSPLDIAYNPTSNLWVIASVKGVYTFPNTGAAGTPVSPAGAITLTQRYSTAGMQNVFWTGTQLVAFGLGGHIISSPDGITWTESGGRIATTNWINAIYDGTRYVLFSSSDTGIIATSPDGLNNYEAKYIMDGARSSNQQNNWGLAGILSGTAPSSAGAFTPNANFAGLNIGGISGGLCSITMSNTSTSNLATFTVSTAQSFGNYYEMVFTKTTTGNTFNLTIYVNGILTATYNGLLMAASTTDTTSLLIINLDRRNGMTGYDDMYFTVNDGQGVVGPLGAINIIAQRPETDVQDQWVKNGSAATNSLSTNQSALSSQSANSVSSANSGDKDIYGTTDLIPAGYLPRAVQDEAFFTKTSTTAPSVSIGTLSGSTEVDSGVVSITGATATYVAQILESDPNGNAAWTASALEAAKFVSTHVV